MQAIFSDRLAKPVGLFYPARTTIAVAALPLGASVEIDVIAAAGGAR
jgi:enamine deaminase RidA (YjgF/YER057c/UK114 family)